jgi:tRNA threonylcarbamoyl adenosine modification protein (Sua5/YciO/YrdC/YwlC family)
VSQFFTVHPSHPQARLLKRAAEIVTSGGLVVFPTDTTYVLGCHIGDKSALDRVRNVRSLGKNHLLTLMVRDLSEVSLYARVENYNYRLLKQLTPGPFTFILPATREVPRRLIHPKRKTIGLRVPDCPVALGLLEALGEPMMTTTLRLPGEDLPVADVEDVRDRLERQVDLIVDGGRCGIEQSTVLDLTGTEPAVIRQGLGEFA